MPVSPTYPGVYIQELPSGVRTISSVATSITAFVGWAPKGLVDEPVRISSFGDFQRKFGGLHVKSAMSYAVQQFYNSGGKDAIIVRVVHSGSGGSGEAAAVAARATLPLGNRLLARVRSAFVSAGVLDTALPAPELTVTAEASSANGLPRYKLVFGVDTGSTDSTYYVTFDANDDATLSSFPLTFIDDLADQVNTEWAAAQLVTPLTGPFFEVIDWPVTGLTPGVTVFAVPVGATDYDVEVAGAPLSAVDPMLTAVSPGAWGNAIVVTVDHDVADSADGGLFNLTVQQLDDDGNPVRSETFRNVTFDPDAARFLGTVLEDESELVGLTTAAAAEHAGYPRPAEVSSAPLTAGVDGQVSATQSIDASDILGSQADKTGIYALEDADLFNLLCLPPPVISGDFDVNTLGEVITYCESRRAVLLVDCPSGWTTKDKAISGIASLGISSNSAAIYFPRVKIADPLRENRLTTFAPCGVVAGLIAKTDATRGVWKAPAGLDAKAANIRGLAYSLTDSENGELNPLGVNCIRSFNSVGHVVWGARTMEGADRLASDWKYLPVRRLAYYIEESLYRGTQWVVFEPNDEPLWSQIRLNVGAFMHSLFRQGAFQGTTPKDAYFVRCDSETTTQDDINRGIVNVLVGFAPLKPAEFVVISIQQMAGQVAA